MYNENTNRIYKPSFFRLYFHLAWLYILGILLGSGVCLLIGFFSDVFGDLERQLQTTTVLISIYAIISFVFLWANKNQFVITITPTSISGPSSLSALGNLKTFPIEKLDTDKLFQRTLWEKLWHERAIRSKGNEKIVISQLSYSKDQEKEIIEKLLSLSNGLQEQ